MKAFNILRLIVFIIGGLLGVGMLMKGCTDQSALSTAAEADYLILDGTYDKRIGGGRNYSARTETWVRGHLASNGANHELSYSAACRYIDCEGLTDSRLNAWMYPRPDSAVFRSPVWSGGGGRVISPREPGSAAVDSSKSGGEIAGGLLLVALIVIPLLLWLAFGNGKLV